MNQLSILPGVEPGSNEGPRVLIVDDDPDSAEITARMLGQGGNFRIRCVESAEEAYVALSLVGASAEEERLAYDIVIMDIMMPQVDGIEATAAIRTTRRGSFVPILMLSGRRDLDALGQAFMAGASDFVTKPIEPVELQARVRTLLRLKREQERRQARERQLVESNRELQQSVIDGTLIDRATGMPSRPWAEMMLRECRNSGVPLSAVMVQIEELDAYIAFHGVRGAERLHADIMRRLQSVPAPLGGQLAVWDEGRFIILLPGMKDSARVAALCAGLQRAVEYPAMPHGNALHHDRVRVSTANGWRPAPQVGTLPSDLIASLAEESFRGRRSVENA